MVPLRLAPALAAAVNATVPLPLPLAPEVIVIHVAPVTAGPAPPAARVRLEGPPPPRGWCRPGGRAAPAGRRHGGPLRTQCVGAGREHGRLIDREGLSGDQDGV